MDIDYASYFKLTVRYMEDRGVVKDRSTWEMSFAERGILLLIPIAPCPY